MKIVDTEEVVLDIIKTYHLGESDDMEVYYYYLSTKNADINKVFISSEYRKLSGIASFGTVERTIRKLHNTHKELFSKEILDMRENEQEKFIKYAIGYEV